MIRAEILSPWDFSGTPEPSNHPRLGDEHQLQGWTDVTGLPAENMVPDPNNGALVATMDEAIFANISADSTYYVQWNEPVEEGAAQAEVQAAAANDKPADGTSDANEFGLLRAYLAQNGFSQAWINGVIGNVSGTRTRAEDAALLRAALAELPKGA